MKMRNETHLDGKIGAVRKDAVLVPSWETPLCRLLGLTHRDRVTVLRIRAPSVRS